MKKRLMKLTIEERNYFQIFENLQKFTQNLQEFTKIYKFTLPKFKVNNIEK